MLYPFKFKPAFKDYIWGGRNLEKLGKVLPEGIVAESWEISCHPDGVSTVSNGEFAGMSMPELIARSGREIVGTALPEKDLQKFPLLVKLIDANDKLSVQVHPDDSYAGTHEKGELGKNEMWYIISAKPGARLIYDVVPGTSGETFARSIKDNQVESCLKFIDVFPGDFINIPAGLVHAIGEGIVLAEIQQNSNTTYRVFDYNRLDKNGNGRPLHIEKSLDVIDFNSGSRKEKYPGLKVMLAGSSSSTYKVANKYFSVELVEVEGIVEETADGSRFFIYVIISGVGEIKYGGGSVSFKGGDSILIPAVLGKYALSGSFSALRTYVPDLSLNVIGPLKKAGYTEEEIYENVAGLTK